MKYRYVLLVMALVTFFSMKFFDAWFLVSFFLGLFVGSEVEQEW